MLNSPFFRLVFLALVICLLIAGGCATTESARFYTLSSLAIPGPEAEAVDRSVAIGVGPIKLPEHLDRPQIVTRTSRNELELAEFDRWAGSLGDDFSRVLAENLSILLSTHRVSIYPWRKSVPVEYQVVVDVARFDGELGKNASLIARWSIFGGRDKKMLFMEKSRISDPALARDYESMVAAQSRALGHLSREIADAIEAISRKGPNQ
ncbi:MAG: hypothetical protein GTN74_12865 [Proteobacteria bacterium]|nr:hypothetical protein [Pseudomonadota bacterium]